MLVTRDLSENTCANRLTANRNRAFNLSRDAFKCGLGALRCVRCSNRLRPYCNFVNSRISRIIPEVRKPKKLAANRKRDYNDKLESSNFEGCGYEILWLTDQILPTRPKKKLFVVVSLMFSRQAGIDRHRHIPGLKRIRCCFRAGRARWKDYFRTTLSYLDTIRLDMGLTYDRIFAPIVNTVLESFTAPEQRTRARAIRSKWPSAK